VRLFSSLSGSQSRRLLASVDVSALEPFAAVANAAGSRIGAARFLATLLAKTQRVVTQETYQSDNSQGQQVGKDAK